MARYPAWVRAKQRDKWRRRAVSANKNAAELIALRFKYKEREWTDERLKNETMQRLHDSIHNYLDIVEIYNWMLDNLSGG